jgi:hypothetical protein
MVPGVKTNSSGIGWGRAETGESVPLSSFYVAKSATDTAESINTAMAAGKHLLLTPGVYRLDKSLIVSRPNTIVLGLGLATLLPENGTPAMEVADVDGVKIAGVLFDAGKENSPCLLQVGAPNSKGNHSANPIYLYDIFCRVGGAGEANVTTAVILNSSNIVGDHAWIWRADHGEGAAWDLNKSKNGIIVNGANITYYGLFVEHFQEYQTVWNGENGNVYFYQCEIPYDVPSTEAWSHDGVKGRAAYKVADNVKKHQATGLGIYSFFRDAPVIMDNAAEAPAGLGIKLTNVLTFWLNGDQSSEVKSIVSGVGNAVKQSSRKAQLLSYPSGS